ncbi:hypothetical protein KBY22_12835 [Ruegeria pomeroyi]|nr:hypothetical protein [Ruegeria pomeroyi]MCE8529156.1 hypothetical protein [Ruegeria pomeroyi]
MYLLMCGAEMSDYEHNSPELGRIHKRNNDKKFFCHFTGFLEGIAASGYVELGEIEPLIAECEEFVRRASDGDAYDIIQDFEADLLEHKMIMDAVAFRINEIDTDCAKSLTNRFLGFCRGVACDGKITLREANEILNFIDRKPELRQTIGVRQIEVCCRDAVADDILTELESEEICNAIGWLVGDCYGDTGIAQTVGVANFSEFRVQEISEEFTEKIVVLTGNFKVSPRRHFEEMLMELGAIVSRSVTKKTDYLIVGGEASRDWIELNRGTKILTAQKMRLNSELPRFVSEGQILRLMKLRA